MVGVPLRGCSFDEVPNKHDAASTRCNGHNVRSIRPVSLYGVGSSCGTIVGSSPTGRYEMIIIPEVQTGDSVASDGL